MYKCTVYVKKKNCKRLKSVQTSPTSDTFRVLPPEINPLDACYNNSSTLLRIILMELMAGIYLINVNIALLQTMVISPAQDDFTYEQGDTTFTL